MSSQPFILFCFQITVLLSAAVVFGQLMRKLGQPAVLGEMLGGILIGSTCLGMLAPSFYNWLFHSSVQVSAARDIIIKLGMLFFLFITGLEIDLSNLKQFGRKALSIGLIGTFIPILIGICLVYGFSPAFWGFSSRANFFPFALFIGINFANSANPVIARILMDLNLLNKEIGTIIMTSTIMDDLVNWVLFSVILNSIMPQGQIVEFSLAKNILIILIFVIAVLLIGRLLRHYAFNWIRKNVAWPVGFIAATIPLIIFISGIAEKIGIHAFFGAFLIGIGMGWADKKEEGKEIRDIITYFALSFFVPLYFVSIGLNANFITNFDWTLVLVITSVAFISKIGAVILGAWAGGMRFGRKVLAIGFGLNTRGATGIILAAIGLEYRLINERLFVALVVMALVTSLVSGPMIKLLLGNKSS